MNDVYLSKAIDRDKTVDSMACAGYDVPAPVAHLRHPSTHVSISVYKPIPKIQQWFLRKCFGLEYNKV